MDKNMKTIEDFTPFVAWGHEYSALYQQYLHCKHEAKRLRFFGKNSDDHEFTHNRLFVMMYERNYGKMKKD